MDWPSNTPDRISTVSGSRRCVVYLFCPGLAAVEPALDRLRAHRHAGRAAIHCRAKRGSMAFAPCRHAEEVAEGVEGHGTPSFVSLPGVIRHRRGMPSHVASCRRRFRWHRSCNTLGVAGRGLRCAVRCANPLNLNRLGPAEGRFRDVPRRCTTGLGFTSPVAWRSEHETHHTCSGIDPWFRALPSGRPPCSRSIPMTVSSPNGAPARPSEAAFEETCGCDLQFVGAGDGAALLSRIRLEGGAVRGGRCPRPRHEPDGRRPRRRGFSRRTGSRPRG